MVRGWQTMPKDSPASLPPTGALALWLVAMSGFTQNSGPHLHGEYCTH